ncbi:hypothetical protein FREDWARD_87 [Mycobacterium phage Fredward]|uniref:hypothetical protein n=1 Tax=Mycobacterium phage Fredward TaxID=1354510 RepID=UPI0003BA120A|nr:hypothetical protein V424_gp026 [Mycobacterium phage Fredward]AGY37029.1 hypothetical protein FREDWARD_87 [Mycobacterium phage Fredward]QXN73056.1 hypothetical protein SEA_PHILLIS_85 [Mycobacterium phage Phillis]
MSIRVLKRHDVDKLTALKETYDSFRSLQAERQQVIDDYYSDEAHSFSEMCDYDEAIADWDGDLAQHGVELADALSEAMGWGR